MRTVRTQLMVSTLVLISFANSWSQGRVGIGDVPPGQVKHAAFSLQNDEKVKVSGRGGAYVDDWKMIVHYGWIIDSETRRVVWHVADDADRPDFDHGDFEIDANVALKKGTYEVYYTSAFYNRDFKGVGTVMDEVFSWRNKEKYKAEIQESMGIEVTGQSLAKLSASTVMQDKIANAVVAIHKPEDKAQIKKGFSLSAPVTLRIYAIGEGGKDDSFDYAWIYNVDSRKRVWVMDYSNSDFAGGAEKNLAVDEKITLPAGNYMVSYSTDDSHSFNNWNAMPPNDPAFSGITIWPASTADSKNVIPFRAAEESKPIVELTRIGDNAYASVGLQVKSAIDMHVLCIGEADDDEMADYGWIMNAKTREVVWDMSKVRSEHAGGASKNRMVDGTIHLDKGDYFVYYVTDGSHSYDDWNSGPPHEQGSYGITLWATRKEDISKAVRFEPNEYKNDNVVVEIVRVRDDENLSESFTLDKETSLRIFALGEGDDGEMVDYGWIKNTDTGKVVWEMTYRNTESAGGAKKNRMFNDTLILPKGSYKVYYETDGSHSYRRWNASPPRDPERYGISLIREIN